MHALGVGLVARAPVNDVVRLERRTNRRLIVHHIGDHPVQERQPLLPVLRIPCEDRLIFRLRRLCLFCA